MHKDFYGAPRSPETYEYQAAWIHSGLARVYFAYSEYGLRVGAAMWYCYKGMAYYASGVYPVGHIAKSIVHASLMCLTDDKGIKYADMGYQGRAVTDKERDIEFFKRGFGGEDWKVPCIRRIFTTHEHEQKVAS